MKDMQIGIYDNFVTTIKSKATRIVYHNNLNLFMQSLEIKDYDQLFFIYANLIEYPIQYS